MGIFAGVSPERVIPNEADLRKESLRYILKCYLSNNENRVSPPVVRNCNGTYYIVDGHNTFTIASLCGKVSVVSYIPEGLIDFISPDQVSEELVPWLERSNKSIEFRFDRCLYDAERLRKEGIVSIFDLRQRFHINSISDVL